MTFESIHSQFEVSLLFFLCLWTDYNDVHKSSAILITTNNFLIENSTIKDKIIDKLANYLTNKLKQAVALT